MFSGSSGNEKKEWGTGRGAVVPLSPAEAVISPSYAGGRYDALQSGLRMQLNGSCFTPGNRECSPWLNLIHSPPWSSVDPELNFSRESAGLEYVRKGCELFRETGDGVPFGRADDEADGPVILPCNDIKFPGSSGQFFCSIPGLPEKV